jgi:hypothetical protein
MKNDNFRWGTKNIERRLEKRRVFGVGLNIRFFKSFILFKNIF